MNLIFFVALGVLGVNSAILYDIKEKNICQQPGVDPDDELLPHESNCRQFYKCDHGEPVQFDCPEDLEFNADLKICDWKEFAGCSSQAPVAPCRVLESVPTCPKHEINKPAVHLPHARDCTRFYQCDWGKAFEKRCPQPLHFSAQLQVCDWPDRAGCPCNP